MPNSQLPKEVARNNGVKDLTAFTQSFRATFPRELGVGDWELTLFASELQRLADVVLLDPV
jgi:hypothetical protein